MEEALEILWTYARREPLDSNGETVVPTINNSIAAIRIIMRLEGWVMGSEKRKGKPSENLELGYVGEKRATHNKPAGDCRGEWQFAQTKFAQCDTDNNDNYDKHDGEYTDGELFNEGKLPFAPTPAHIIFLHPSSDGL